MGTRIRGTARRGWLAVGLGLALGLAPLSSAQTSHSPPSLRGQIVDTSGRLLVEDWKVEVFESSEDPRMGRWAQRSYTTPHEASGLFAHRGSGRGPLVLRARHASGLESELVEVEANETFVTLVYAGPAPESTIVLHARHADRVTNAPPLDPGHACAVRGRSEPVAFRALDCTWMTLEDAWIATGLEPGSYDIEYRDPRFERTLDLRVATGSSAGLTLRGSAGLQVSVRSGVGRPLPHALVVGRVDDASRQVVQSPGDAVGLEPVAVEGLYPGKYALTVLTAEQPGVVVVVDLAPHETRAVRIPLAPLPRVTGSVLDETGSPVPNARVSAALELSLDEQRLRRFIGMGSVLETNAVEAEAGTFSLELPPSQPVRFTVVVSDREDVERRFQSPVRPARSGEHALQPLFEAESALRAGWPVRIELVEGDERGDA